MNRLDSELLDQLAGYIVENEYWDRKTFSVTPGDTLTTSVILWTVDTVEEVSKRQPNIQYPQYLILPSDTDFAALTEFMQRLTQRALDAWSEVSGIQFELVDSDPHDADIRFIVDNRPTIPRAGVSYKDGIISSADVYIPLRYFNGDGDSIDSHTFGVFLHELGHGLGLAHPGIYSSPYVYGEDNLFANDSDQTTVMSYFNQQQNTDLDASYALPVTPMIADIIAIHDLYGIPVHREGDTVYGVDSNIGGHLGAVFADWTSGNFDNPITLTLFDSGGTDTLDLSTDTQNQHVVLQSETASDVYGLRGNLVIARDTLIENYVAGAGDDIIVGNETDNVLEGSAGVDSLDGDSGSDTAAYTGSAAAVTVNLGTNTATGGDAEGDTFTSIENLTGSAHDDTLTGDTGNNVLEGRGGADTLDGGDGTDTASYAASNFAVTVDLLNGTATGGHAAGDTLTSIESLSGSRYSDALTGDAGVNRLAGGAGNDRLEGRAGADTLVGGTGLDTASYAASAVAVMVNLSDSTATGGDAQGDTFDSIENLTGSAHDDTLIGDADNNVLEGGAGADTLDGGEGIDTASYAGSASRVDVRLSGTVVNYGDATGDTLTNIENLIGSAHNDILVGNGQANALTGMAGNDLLWASSGDDLLTGGPGADRLVGGAGNDTASFADSPEGVTVRLHSLSAANGDAQGGYLPLHRGRHVHGR